MNKIRTAALCGLLAGASGSVLAVPFPGNAELVSRKGDGSQIAGDSYEGAISNNARIVAWHSDAPGIDGPTGGKYQIFVRDRTTGGVAMITKDGTGAAGDEGSYYPSVSANGRYVAYMSYAPSITGSNSAQILRYDRVTAETQLVSAAGDGGPANSESDIYEGAPMSANGRWIVFESFATDLGEGGGSGRNEIFLADMKSGAITRITAAGESGPDGDSTFPSISPNGRWVVFRSLATNLIQGDGNGRADHFLYDVRRRRIETVSVAQGGVAGDGPGAEDYGGAAVTNNGRWIAFPSDATNLDAGSADGNGYADVFLRDRRADTTTRLSDPVGGGQTDNEAGDCAIHPSGKYVTWWTYARNTFRQSAMDYTQVVWDRASDSLIEALQAPDGGEVGGIGVYGYAAQMSANGRWYCVAAESDIAVQDDSNGRWDIFVVDMLRKAPEPK